MSNPDHIHVLAAVMEDQQGRLLVCQRPAHKRHGGLWEFPGGKIELGESPFDAAKRELAEELQLDVTDVGDLLFSAHDAGSAFVIDFFRVLASGDPAPTEHSAIAWLPPDQLLTLPLAPSDELFARCLTGVGPC